MINREDIKIKELNESCDECEDDPIILGGFFNNKCLFSECLHEESDRDNVIDDIIDTCLDIIAEDETRKTLRYD